MTRPLSIAFFAREFPALSETFVLNQVTGMIDLGHDVTVFAERPRDEPKRHPEVARYGLERRICYLGLPESRPRRVAGAIVGFTDPNRRGRRAEFRAMNVLRYGREAVSLHLLFWARALEAYGPFDIVHCHFGLTGRVAAFLRETGALAGKLVTSFHGVDVAAVGPRLPSYYGHLRRHGDLFLPISLHWRDRLVEGGFDPGRTVVHRMGVDLDRFAFRPRRLERGRPLRLLTIGRLIEKKGVAYGLRAFAGLGREAADAEYVIAGDGPLRNHLEAAARALGCADRVRFLGWQTQEAIASLLASSDVLLAPSVTGASGDQEGIPVTLMEAMATGMPVVSTRHSGIPELVEDGVTGLLVEERDGEGLTDALRSLIENPERWPELGRAARAKVAAEYDVRRLNERLVDRYRALLGEASRPGADRDHRPFAA